MFRKLQQVPQINRMDQIDPLCLLVSAAAGRSLISIEHAELLRSTPSLVLCCAWLVTMALHVHGGLGQLSPLPTSGDDK